jgi:hypothetical protein
MSDVGQCASLVAGPPGRVSITKRKGRSDVSAVVKVSDVMIAIGD